MCSTGHRASLRKVLRTFLCSSRCSRSTIVALTPSGSRGTWLRTFTRGSYTFWEQRNMVENLHQGVREDATDFIIRVGTSISNLGKDWKDQLMEEELQSLQYKVSLNGVREEIQHVLDSKITRHGRLTPHQMYEAVKKYETYVACNKHLKGKSASPSLITRGLWLRLLATNLTFIKPLPSLPQVRRPQILLLQSQDLLFQKTKTTQKWSRPWKMMRDCSSPVSWRRL